MKRNIVIILLFVLLLILCSCGGKEEIATLTEKNTSLQGEIDSLKKELSDAAQSLEAASKQHADDTIKIAELEKIQREYDEYKQKMSEYEGLEKAEAEARQIEAERVKAQEKAEKEKKAEEERLAKEQAAREAEEKAKRGYDTGITYDQLARTPDKYKGEKVKFRGRVIQVLESDSEIDLRIAVNDNYDWVILVFYPKNLVASRVLENDYITIYGVSQGLYTYESTIGGNITVPLISVDKIDQ